MKERKIFITLFLLVTAGLVYWYFFVDYKQTQEIEQLNKALGVIIEKVENAKLAKDNIAKLEAEYKIEQKKLLLEKERFVNRNDLSVVTKTLKEYSEQNHLKLMDFAPAFASYFADSTTDKVVTLPIELSVQGKYFDIGRFIEGWEKLPFYLIARELIIERAEPKSNILNAKINAVLYTWNEF